MAIRPHPLIPAGGAAAVDRVLARTRPDVCTVQKPVATRSPGGAPVAGYATVAVVDCSVAVPGRTPVEAVAGGRLAAVGDYEVRLPRGTDVKSDFRILVNGKTLEVVDDRDAVSFGFQTIVVARATG